MTASLELREPISEMTRYRADIDGLRAIAVLAVIGFHGFPQRITGGFVGVDVFFVISGYLISTILYQSLEANRFSFASFYSRRIKRIFPALSIVLLACLGIGWLLLLPDEYQHLGKHVLSGVTFVSNFVLWEESGYFDSASETKPLLHLWSLGIEEQFYIAWPLLLWSAYGRRLNLLAITAAIGAVSFFLNAYWVSGDVIAAFYSPLARIWELMLGSMLAYVIQTKAQAPSTFRFIANDQLSAIGAFLILGSILFFDGSTYPGWKALVPTIGTAMVISAGPGAKINRLVFANRLLVWIGLISFPLYLWHWPLLVFTRILYGGTTPSPIFRIGAISVAFLLAWLTYQTVEKRIRFGTATSAKPILLVLLMIGCGLLGYSCIARTGFPERDVGFRSLDKDFVDTHRYPEAENCKTTLFSGAIAPDKCSSNSDKPEILLIGDSHAGHYYKALTSSDLKVAIIWNGGCYPGSTTSRCVEKQKAIEWYIESNRANIKMILLAGYLNLYLNERRISGEPNNSLDRKGLVDAARLRGGDPSAIHFVTSDYINFLTKIRNLNIRIGIVGDVPELNRTPLGCHIRNDCNQVTPRQAIEESQSNAREIFAKLAESFPSLQFFSPLVDFCDAKYCYSEVDGKLLYFDDNHLNENGSYMAGAKLISWIRNFYTAN